MNAFYTLCAAAVILSVIWLLITTFTTTSYRCSKCGYQTDSEIEARIHEKVENMHKMIN